MNEDGKKFDYIVEVECFRDETGVMLPGHSLKVWADENMKSVIEGVAGVTNVYNGIPTKTQFSVYLDHRYDVNFVKTQIEKAIEKASQL